MNISAVTLHTPDKSPPVELAFTQPEGRQRVQFRVPRLRVYGVVEIAAGE